MNFKEFESKYYDFYRFSSLVRDLLIIPNNYRIPYDIEMKIIYTSYITIDWELLELNSNLTPYDLQERHIKNDANLFNALFACNEN